MGTSLRNIRQHCIHRFRSRVSRIDRETVYRLHPRNGRYCIPSQGYYIPPPFLSKFPENFSTINFPWILSNQIKRIHHKLLIRLREFRKKIRNNKLDSFIDTKREFTLSISFEDFPLRAKPLPLLRKRGGGGGGNAVAFPNCYCNRPSFQNRNGLGATSFETAAALLSNPLMALFEKLRSMELFSSETIFLAQGNNSL